MKYDFSHPDCPDVWTLTVPDNLPQKFNMMPCIATGTYKLTVGKTYRNIGWSSMGNMIWVFDDNDDLILVDFKCFIKI